MQGRAANAAVARVDIHAVDGAIGRRLGASIRRPNGVLMPAKAAKLSGQIDAAAAVPPIAKVSTRMNNANTDFIERYPPRIPACGKQLGRPSPYSGRFVVNAL